jgi:hypothetical protein
MSAPRTAIAATGAAFGIVREDILSAGLNNLRQLKFNMIWVRIATPPHNQVVYRIFSNL